MLDVARAADDSPFESIWVYDQLENLRNSGLAGPPEQVVDHLAEARTVGMTYAIAYFPVIACDSSGFTLFTEQVIPALAAV